MCWNIELSIGDLWSCIFSLYIFLHLHITLMILELLAKTHGVFDLYWAPGPDTDSQSPQENSVIFRKLGHDLFIPLWIHHSMIRRCSLDLLKRSLNLLHVNP
jgi:hypothetical protein